MISPYIELTEPVINAIDGLKAEIQQLESGGYFAPDYITEKLNRIFRSKGVEFTYRRHNA